MAERSFLPPQFFNEFPEFYQKYDQGLEIRKCIEYAVQNLPEDGPCRLEIVSALEQLSEMNPPIFSYVLPAHYAYDLPETCNPHLLAFADFLAMSKEDSSSGVTQLIQDSPIELTPAHFFSMAAMSSHPDMVAAQSLPIINDCAATELGLGRFPFQMPREWHPHGPLAGRNRTDKHVTSFSLTYALAGTANHLHEDYLGGHNLLVALDCYKVFLIWPASPQNIAAMRRYWTANQLYRISWALNNLENLRVLILRDPIAFLLGPLDIHAVITLRNSVHIGGPVWSPLSAPAAMDTIRCVFGEIENELETSYEDLDIDRLLAFWEETRVCYQDFLKLFNKAVENCSERAGVDAGKLGELSSARNKAHRFEESLVDLVHTADFLKKRVAQHKRSRSKGKNRDEDYRQRR